MTKSPDNSVFFVKSETGKTAPSWLTKLLVWMTPALFVSGGAFLLFSSFIWVVNAQQTTGTVTSISQIETENGVMLYSPTFSYVLPDGAETTGRLGIFGPQFNLAIGTEQIILYDPALNGNVRFPGFTFNYVLASVILSIGVMFALISAVLWAWVKSLARKRDTQPKASS